MKRMALILLCVLVIPVVATADLTITEKVSAGGFMGMGGSEGVETTYIKGNMIRNESEMTYKGMMAGMAPGMKGKGPERTVTIMDLDKGVVWNLDEEAKTYTEIALKSDSIPGGADMESQFDIKSTKLTKTGKKRDIAGYKCDGVNVEIVAEVGPKDQKMTTTTDILFWLAPDKKELHEMRDVWKRMAESMGSGEQSFGMKEAMDELAGVMDELNGVPLGMDISMDMPMGEGGGQQAEMQEAMKQMREMMKGQGEEKSEEAGEAEEAGQAEEAPSNKMTVRREAISISDEDLDNSLFSLKGYTKKTSEFGQ
jgi:hypothetical protein